jgi:tetraacyldisaccharide 4'-kinase
VSNRLFEGIEEFAVDVILERRFGKRATLLRAFLWILSQIYGWIMRLRWYAYDRHFFKSCATGCMVVSVGNLTVGGTGKTPVVEKVARGLMRAGRKVAILSRGYKSVPKPFFRRLIDRMKKGESGDPPRVVSDGVYVQLDSEHGGDEPFMLASNLKGVAVIVDKDRIKSARYAVSKLGVDTLVLDDGYQYLRLKERFNILLVDRQAPFGNRYILPRGTLREPKDHLKRGDAIFITKCDGSDINDLKKEIRQYNGHAPIFECRHRPAYLQDIYSGERAPLEYLKNRKVGAVSGIAVPESFEEAIKNLGAEIIYSKHYADHHRFSEQEILNAIARTRARGGHALVLTEKDAVRVPKVDRGHLPVYFLRVEIELTNGENFEKCVLDLLDFNTSEVFAPVRYDKRVVQ